MGDIFNLGFSIWFSRKVMDKSNELDFSSTEFNALDALTNNVDIPVPEAPVYDNLGQFISTVRNRGRSRPNHDQAGPSNQDDRWNTSRRRFLPHQGKFSSILGHKSSSSSPSAGLGTDRIRTFYIKFTKKIEK